MAVRQRFTHDVSGANPPAAIVSFREPSFELRAFARSERRRMSERLERLVRDVRLRRYEETYGCELGAGDGVPSPSWSSRVAVEPYPASVRARRIAVATRCGGQGLERELARAARAILRLPEIHLMGNHLLENGFGLACAGAAVSGAEGDLWWATGCEILKWQLGRQFLADGAHCEGSATYHVALLAALLETVELAIASGRGARPEWRDLASRALGWAEASEAPDGTHPLFNDAAVDAAPPFDAVKALARSLDVRPCVKARVEAAGEVRTTLLEGSGWARLDVPGATLIVDGGPDGDRWQPGHAHADGLTFELWVEGARAVVDFGVASYGDDEARRETRATGSHNTVEVADTDSCEVWGAFRVGRRSRGRVMNASAGDGTASLVLEHDGYSWMPGAPQHRRSIELRSGRLEVRDRIVGGHYGWTSRVRLSDQVEARLRVNASAPVGRTHGRWHLRHGEARAATVLEQAGRDCEVTWRLEW
jgi:hypothetical protein